MPRVDLGLGVKLKVRTKILHEPTPYTRHQVAMMASFGIQQVKMAKILRINEETLVRHYEEELELGKDKANILVAGELFKLAMLPRASMIKLQAINKWLGTRAKESFQEITRNEHSGPDGKAIETDNANANVGMELDDSERAIRLLQLLAQRNPNQQPK